MKVHYYCNIKVVIQILSGGAGDREWWAGALGGSRSESLTRNRPLTTMFSLFRWRHIFLASRIFKLRGDRQGAI